MPITLQELQQTLQYTFQNPALLQRALTHRSFSADNNERLEFLGDSVLSLAISSLLFQRLRELPEGDLSRVRSNLVKEGTLHQIALKLQLPELLRPCVREGSVHRLIDYANSHGGSDNITAVILVRS